MASGSRLGDTVKEAAPEVVRRRLLKALLVAASLLGIAFAVAATSPLDGPFGASMTQQAGIIVTVAVPTPTTNVAEVPNPASPTDNRMQERRLVAAKIAVRVTTRARIRPVSPKPSQVAVVQSEQSDQRVAQMLVDGRYIRTAL